jgi:hypothetical protein
MQEKISKLEKESEIVGLKINIAKTKELRDRLCGLVVSVEDYKHRGPGFDSRALVRIFLRELGLERGPLSLVIG